MKTFMLKAQDVKNEWVLIDAAGKPLGRLASKIALILRGKDKVTYTPHTEVSTGVIVINIEKMVATGNKMKDKRYYWHTQFPGGIRFRTLGQLMETKPEMPLLRAVKGMLPKNISRHRVLTRLRIFKGETHPHTAQQPRKIEI